MGHFVRSRSFIGQMHPKIQNWNFFFPISLEMIEDHEIETMLMYNFKLKKKLYHKLFGINDERTLCLNLFVRKQVFPRVK